MEPIEPRRIDCPQPLPRIKIMKFADSGCPTCGGPLVDGACPSCSSERDSNGDVPEAPSCGKCGGPLIDGGCPSCSSTPTPATPATTKRRLLSLATGRQVAHTLIEKLLASVSRTNANGEKKEPILIALLAIGAACVSLGFELNRTFIELVLSEDGRPLIDQATGSYVTRVVGASETQVSMLVAAILGGLYTISKAAWGHFVHRKRLLAQSKIVGLLTMCVFLGVGFSGCATAQRFAQRAVDHQAEICGLLRVSRVVPEDVVDSLCSWQWPKFWNADTPDAPPTYNLYEDTDCSVPGSCGDGWPIEDDSQLQLPTDAGDAVDDTESDAGAEPPEIGSGSGGSGP